MQGDRSYKLYYWLPWSNRHLQASQSIIHRIYFFSSANGIFTMIPYILSHKTNPKTLIEY